VKVVSIKCERIEYEKKICKGLCEMWKSWTWNVKVVDINVKSFCLKDYEHEMWNLWCETESYELKIWKYFKWKCESYEYEIWMTGTWHVKTRRKLSGYVNGIGKLEMW
jgi:hypothetical protein